MTRPETVSLQETEAERLSGIRINEILDEVKDFDYVAFMDGRIDGEFRIFCTYARRNYTASNTDVD